MVDLVTSFNTGYIFTSGHSYAVFGAYWLFRFVKSLGLDCMIPVCPRVCQLLGLPHDPQLQIVLPSIGYCKSVV
jgi:hypothetical protein